jgi:hypothetical protein
MIPLFAGQKDILFFGGLFFICMLVLIGIALVRELFTLFESKQTRIQKEINQLRADRARCITRVRQINDLIAELGGDPMKDNCELCEGEKGGIPGNENIGWVDGKRTVVCDYCYMERRAEISNTPPEAK